MRSFTPIAVLLVCTTVGVAMPPVATKRADDYVEEAMRRNLALQTQTLDLEQAQARLAEARSAYEPHLDLLARYSVADGGRTIDLPVGDLLNGVYRTLNDYLRTQGRPAAFPQISNQSIPLLREHEQETKLRLTQSVYRPEITRGVRASRAVVASREAQVAAFRRELRLSVLSGYYNYLQSELAVEILQSSAALTSEALRTNRILFEAEKVTEDRVLRAEADDLGVSQQLAEGERDRNQARHYFNFLLNRPLDTAIDRAPEETLRSLADTLLGQPASAGLTIDRREELQALERAVEAAIASEDALRARLYPTVALAVDAGIQGTRYQTGPGANFVQGSLVAEFNVWDGHQRRSQLEQARISRRAIEVQLESTRLQLGLQLAQARDHFSAMIAAYRAALRRADAIARAFDLVAKRDREGLVNQLNFIDARSELTRAELNRAITRERLFVAAVALDRAAALSPPP